jgi:hypothetical protein
VEPSAVGNRDKAAQRRDIEDLRHSATLVRSVMAINSLPINLH